MAKAAVVIVPGCFQISLVYQRLSQGIRARGYRVTQLELPSCAATEGSDFTSKDLNDDTAAARKVIEDLVEKDHQSVIVVMHSYGGLVGSNSIPEELTLSNRRSRSLPGGVCHLFYFSAFILGKGQSVLGTFGGSPNNDVKDGQFRLKNGASLLYNDLTKEEAAIWEDRMIPHSYAVTKTELTRAAYDYVPSTYLICENDQVLPLQVQEMFAAATGSEVQRCDCGHSPMLSQPEKLISMVVNAAIKATS